MQAPLLYTLQSQTLWLSAERSIYWEEERALIVSDLHFGKTGHFRKWGIGVPQNLYKEDLQRLIMLLDHFKPTQLIVVGDFFHSSANMELDWFKRWREDFAHIKIILVRGNHDILKDAWYAEANIDVVYPTLQVGPFLFSHDQCDAITDGYSFCGHIHPGVLVYGLGKQSLRFPCFYFGHQQCILPAFSKFTGAVPMEKNGAESIYAIVESELIKLS